MFNLLSILVTASAVITINAQSFHKYEINIDHMEMAKKDLLIDYGTLRVKKYNRTLYTLDGYIDIIKPLSDDISAQVDIFANYGNEFKKILDTGTQKLCTFLKNDKNVVAKIINSTSLAPAITQCPLLGRIHFYNSHMPIERLPLEPVLNKGKFRLKLLMGEILMADISMYFILTKQTALH